MSGKTKEDIKKEIKDENEEYQDYLADSKKSIKYFKDQQKRTIEYVNSRMRAKLRTKQETKAEIASHKRYYGRFIEGNKKGLIERKAEHKKTMKELREKMKVNSTRKRCPKGTRKNKSGNCV